MRFRRKPYRLHEGDMTPMIDMTFQLIAFFMVLINFTQAEQHEQILLPESVLARPPESPLENTITLHLSQEGTVFIGGDEVSLEGLKPFLVREANMLASRGKTVADANVIIRAHRQAETGKVQELMKVCQEERFENFTLRAKEDVN
jgi:biopolymer transport protein ExbD